MFLANFRGDLLHEDEPEEKQHRNERGYEDGVLDDYDVVGSENVGAVEWVVEENQQEREVKQQFLFQ
jgi:hypothetical protein